MKSRKSWVAAQTQDLKTRDSVLENIVLLQNYTCMLRRLRPGTPPLHYFRAGSASRTGFWAVCVTGLVPSVLDRC